ncbi:1235_t:CDS:2, partial [Acaulospora colombiana]
MRAKEKVPYHYYSEETTQAKAISNRDVSSLSSTPSKQDVPALHGRLSPYPAFSSIPVPFVLVRPSSFSSFSCPADRPTLSAYPVDPKLELYAMLEFPGRFLGVTADRAPAIPRQRQTDTGRDDPD